MKRLNVSVGQMERPLRHTLRAGERAGAKRVGRIRGREAERRIAYEMVGVKREEDDR
jgi:hypothetical protein